MKKLMWILILLFLLAGCAKDEPIQTEPPTAPITETTAETEPEPVVAPDFTMYDVEGNAVKLSDFFGKPIVLNFWASWCGPCKMEMPDFNEKFLEIGGEVQFLMVNLTDGSYETLETAKEFVDNSGYSFPVYYDLDSEGAAVYGVSAIPLTWFIASDGTLVAYANQAIDMELLEQGLSMITGE